MYRLRHILICATVGLGALFTTSCSGPEEESNTDTPAEVAMQTKHPSDRHAYYTDPLGYRRDENKRERSASSPKGTRTNERIRVNNIGRLPEVFNDSNKYQYAWAERLGIEPICGIGDAFRTRRPLRKIASCDAYMLDNLTHSLPYLVPEAEDLLRTIGYNFIDSLASRGGSGYKIKVTSVLRTPSTVKRLKRVNKNATDSSTHQFGTTFDISWAKFACSDTSKVINDGDLKNLLAEVLLDLKKQKRCMVKFERKSPCFHITVTKPE